ncbi:MAG: hydroxyisourate hydrolase [Luteolibacter sp.]
MGKLTTHVLDTASGNPAQGVRIRLYQGGALIKETTTNHDGRCDNPLTVNPLPGEYEIVFSMGDYFRAQGVVSPFLNEIPVRFLIEDGRSYHVPLACSPFAYSTYRGS